MIDQLLVGQLLNHPFTCFSPATTSTGTAPRSWWSCLKRSAMNWWRRRAAACWRQATGSATPPAKRRPSKSTWTEGPPKTLDRTERRGELSFPIFYLTCPLQCSAASPATLAFGPHVESTSPVLSGWRSLLWAPERIACLRVLLCTIVYCTVKFKGKCKSYFKFNIIQINQFNNTEMGALVRRKGAVWEMFYRPLHFALSVRHLHWFSSRRSAFAVCPSLTLWFWDAIQRIQFSLFRRPSSRVYSALEHSA